LTNCFGSSSSNNKEEILKLKDEKREVPQQHI